MFKHLIAVGILALAGLTAVSGQETRSFTDDAGRTVEIPTQPLRIVSLQDLAITVPLLELGVTPIGSHAGQRLKACLSSGPATC